VRRHEEPVADDARLPVRVGGRIAKGPFQLQARHVFRLQPGARLEARVFEIAAPTVPAVGREVEGTCRIGASPGLGAALGGRAAAVPQEVGDRRDAVAVETARIGTHGARGHRAHDHLEGEAGNDLARRRAFPRMVVAAGAPFLIEPRAALVGRRCGQRTKAAMRKGEPSCQGPQGPFRVAERRQG
jgi:hypothetical protein